jgi:hypothetical protein
MICLWSFARQTPKVIPLASVGICSYNAKIGTGADVLVRNSSRDDNHIAGAHLDVLATFAAESQSRCARIDAKHFMRRAMVMRKGIDSVSPRVGPVVLGETFFKNGRRIFGLRCDCLVLEQQGKGTIWENAVILEIQLLRLNEVVLLDHIEVLPREI